MLTACWAHLVADNGNKPVTSALLSPWKSSVLMYCTTRWRLPIFLYMRSSLWDSSTYVLTQPPMQSFVLIIACSTKTTHILMSALLTSWWKHLCVCVVKHTQVIWSPHGTHRCTGCVAALTKCTAFNIKETERGIVVDFCSLSTQRNRCPAVLS